jgi:hypothetical protein
MGLPTGSRLGRYEILSAIGAGGCFWQRPQFGSPQDTQRKRKSR